MLVIGAAVLQQAARQLLPVELGKQVLVTDVCQQLDHLLQRVLNGLISQLLTPTLQLVIAVAQDAVGGKDQDERASLHPLHWCKDQGERVSLHPLQCTDRDKKVSLKSYPRVYIGGRTTASASKGRQEHYTSISNLGTPTSGLDANVSA